MGEQLQATNLNWFENCRKTISCFLSSINLFFYEPVVLTIFLINCF